LSAAAVHDDANAHNLPAVRSDNIDGFLDAAAARDHVFRHDKPLVRPDLKATPEDETARVFLDENMALTQRSPNFLPDHDAAKGRGDDRVAFKVAKFLRQPAAHVRRYVGILEEKRTLKKLAAMQAGAQDEMTIQQSACSSKECEQILAHLSGGVARRLAAGRRGIVKRDRFNFDPGILRQSRDAHGRARGRAH
jgi:hypothetical protein